MRRFSQTYPVVETNKHNATCYPIHVEFSKIGKEEIRKAIVLYPVNLLPPIDDLNAANWLWKLKYDDFPDSLKTKFLLSNLVLRKISIKMNDDSWITV